MRQPPPFGRAATRASPVLSPDQRVFVAGARRAILGTLAPGDRPRLVPVCLALANQADGRGRPIVYTPLDEKPKQVDDPRELARVRDLLVRPAATLLVDRWDEDWRRLGWVRLEGRAELLEAVSGTAEHAAAVRLLRAKYHQYLDQRIDQRPIIRLAVDRVVSWGDLDPLP